MSCAFNLKSSSLLQFVFRRWNCLQGMFSIILFGWWLLACKIVFRLWACGRWLLQFYLCLWLRWASWGIVSASCCVPWRTSGMDECCWCSQHRFSNVFATPNLVAGINIIDPTDYGETENYAPRNLNSLYLQVVDEKGIIDSVNKCNNKTSTDWTGIDMTLNKSVINSIVKPLTY